jgi:hypothetical protein
MAKRTRADYEQILTLAYKGYTAEGIQDIVGKNAANVNNILQETKIGFKAIRQMKRDGVTLAQIMSGIDWSFLERKAESRAKQCEKMRQAKLQPAPSNNDIAEIKAMLTEIYEALTSPKAAPSLMSKVANGVFRN